MSACAQRVARRKCLILAWLLAPAMSFGADDEVEEIIVTATRIPTELRKTPLSVSALTGQELEEASAVDIIDWFARVPGLNYTDDGLGTHRTTIRGITSATQDLRPATAWYLDDVPLNTASGSPLIGGQIGGPNPLAFDLERVEVLRGPQGTLFGSTSLGGAVRLITHAPDLTQFSGVVQAGYSSTEHGEGNLEANAMVNLPLASERAALRLVGYHVDSGGYIDDTLRDIRDVNAVETTGGRALFDWQVSPALKLGARIHAQNRDSRGRSDADVAAGPYAQQRNFDEKDDEAWAIYDVVVDYELPWAALESSTSYTDRQPDLEFDSSGLAAFNFPDADFAALHDVNDGVRDFVQELRLVSANNEPFSWVAGVYYQRQDRSFTGRWVIPGYDDSTGGEADAFGEPDVPFRSDLPATQRQQALYADGGYAFAEAWRVSLGARWSNFQEQLDETLSGALLGGSVHAQASYEDDSVTPRAGLEYRPNDQLLLFLNAAKGFRPGGVNASASDPTCAAELQRVGASAVFTSDSLWNYELGFRAQPFDGRLAVSGAMYYIDWRDMQTILAVNCFGTVIGNAGHATGNGLELELSWYPNDWFEMNLAAGYVDSHLADDAKGLGGVDGQRIPAIPDWTIGVEARYERQLVPGSDGYVQADWQYVAGNWSDWDTSLRRRVPSRELLNLRCGAAGHALEVELFVDNVFDERGVMAHSNSVFGDWEVLVQPRTGGVRASWHF